jgi:predicted hydrocarbon binding protein
MKRSKEHVSLADLMRRTGRPLPCVSSDDLESATPPTVDDLAHSLLFTPGDGRIWLNDQRMLLLHASALGALRRELIATIGHQESRALLTRVGYTSGAKDAEFIRGQWPSSELAAAFNAGPRLHCLEGFVKVTPVRFEFDVDRGKFFGEFLWHDSSEAAESIAANGIGSAPACWTQLGYASGYASAFLGKLILYREVECMAMGAPHCRIVGRPADEWKDSEDDSRFYGARSRGRPANEQSRLPEHPPNIAPLTEFPRSGTTYAGASRAHRCHGALHGGVGRRQGIVFEGTTRSEWAREWALRRSELRRHSGLFDRVGAFRGRARRIYRSDDRARGALRACSRRHVVVG